MYFNIIWVGRQLEFEGGFIALNIASTTPSSVMRAGLYNIGSEAGNHWDIGSLITDMGTQAADAAGHLEFTATETLDRGWYAIAFGTDGAGARASFNQWMTPNQVAFMKYSSGTASDIRSTGIAAYVYENNQDTEIQSGLSTTPPGNPASDVESIGNYQHQVFIPKWSEPA